MGTGAGIEDLPDSRLGTLDYWEALYQSELQNLADHGDEGEVWFGRAAERRLVDYIARAFPHSSAIADLGSGNGHFCFSLAAKGFTALWGIDYSSAAVQLASSAGSKCGLEGVQFVTANLLDPSTLPPSLHRSFDVVVDKGTFDAICLGTCDSSGYPCRTAYFVDKYLQSLAVLGRHQQHHFIITSCNWTRDELVELFGGHYRVVDQVAHASFTFGKSSGSTIATVVFQSK